MSHSAATSDPLLLERAYIEGWVLALTFGAEEELRAGHIVTGLVAAAMSIIGQIVVIRWPKIRARIMARTPLFAEKFSQLVSDPKWWIFTLMAFLAYLALSPYVQQQRWPFSAWFPIVVHDGVTPASNAFTPQQVEEQKAQAVESYKSSHPVTVVHDPPTSEEVAKAAGDTLRAVTAERDAPKEQNNLLRQKVPNPPPIPPPPRPKPTIGDLLAESGTLLDIVKKTLIPLEKEWRETLGGQNPERICIGVSSSSLQDEAASLSGRLRVADKAILDILEQNRIDRKELAALIDYPAQSDETRLATTAYYLDQYKRQIEGFGDHPTCEGLIKADASYRYREMTGQLNGFNQWVLQANERLSDYRDVLRKELRNAP